MPRVEGPDWESTRRLRAAVEGRPGDFVIRWGRGQNKLEQLRLMQDAGIEIPKFTTNIREAIRLVNKGEMWWGRKIRHTQGTDIQLPWRHGIVGGKLRKKWIESEWWVEFIPSIEEWRIHVVDGLCIARGKKVQSQPNTRIALVRSRKNGWHMAHGLAPSKEMRQIAKAACAATGIDAGAVDLMVKENGGLVILEINTLPSLRDDYTLNAYVSAFMKRLNIST